MLGQEFKNARQTLGLSQEKVAEGAGISRNYLSELERNLKSPTVRVFLKLCGVLEIKGSELIAKIEINP